MIDDVIQSAQTFVDTLRSKSSPRQDLQARLKHVRSGILRVAETTMLFGTGGRLPSGPDDAHAVMRVSDQLRERLLSAWGYSGFLQHQIDSGLTDRRRLAEYGEGMLEELTWVQEQLGGGQPR